MPQVVHYGCPKTVEAYYQESGRAGRDGAPAEALLLYSPAELAGGRLPMATAAQAARDSNGAAAMKEYVIGEGRTCRRRFLLAHFGEAYWLPAVGGCANCEFYQCQLAGCL